MPTSRFSPFLLTATLQLAAIAAFAQTQSAGPQAAISPGKVVASGTVPDEAAKATLLARLQEVYGTGQVVDQLSVGGVITPPNWTTHVSRLLTPQIKSISKGQLMVEGTTVSLRGEVPNEAVRQTIASEFAGALTPAYVIKNGLRVTAASQNVIDQVLANRVVEFEHGSALLTDTGKAILDEMVEALKKINARKIDVIGHTDNVGSPSRNLSLSRARADSVKTYLVGKGIQSELVATSGIGADQPLVSNASEEGRRRNRRIEFRVSQ